MVGLIKKEGVFCETTVGNDFIKINHFVDSRYNGIIQLRGPECRTRARKAA